MNSIVVITAIVTAIITIAIIILGIMFIKSRKDHNAKSLMHTLGAALPLPSRWSSTTLPSMISSTTLPSMI